MINYEKLKAYDSGDSTVTYGPRDCIIYALGIGVGLDPMDKAQIRFVYERQLEAFPTMAGVIGWMGRSLSTNPEFGVDEKRVVAAEQRVVLHRPLKTGDTLVSRTRVKEVIDKGEGGGAIILAARELREPGGALVATVETSTFARGQGGFGGPVSESPAVHKLPETAPELTCDLPTAPNQAILYRLSGDENPLHVDPERAKVAGFPKPILHGLGTYGVAAHALLRTIANYDTARFKSMEARFVKPVFPGDTIRTEMWRNREEISFRCRVVERDEIVLGNGLARIA
jgi:acyl dehydratase